MDTQEYKTLNKCYPDVITCLGQSPEDIVIQLRPLGIMAPGDESFLQNPRNSKADKARRIADVVLNQVKTDKQVYYKLVKGMRASGDWTKATVCKLEEELAKQCTPEEDRGKNYIHSIHHYSNYANYCI